MVNISPAILNSVSNIHFGSPVKSIQNSNLLKGISFKGGLEEDSFQKSPAAQDPFANLTQEQKANIAQLKGSQGVSLYNAKKLPAAMSLFNQAIELAPDDVGTAEAYHFRGNVNMELKNYEAAIADYAKAFELRPDSVNSLRFMGQAKVAYALSLPQEEGSKAVSIIRTAIQDYDKCLTIREEPQIYHSKAKAFMNIGGYKEAVQTLDQEIALVENLLEAENHKEKPGTNTIKNLKFKLADAHHVKGDCYQHLVQGQGSPYYDKACQEYTTALEYFPKSPNTLYQRARVNYRINIDAAKADIRAAMDMLEKPGAKYWKLLSDILAGSDDPQEQQESNDALVQYVLLRGTNN